MPTGGRVPVSLSCRRFPRRRTLRQRSSYGSGSIPAATCLLSCKRCRRFAISGLKDQSIAAHWGTICMCERPGRRTHCPTSHCFVAASTSNPAVGMNVLTSTKRIGPFKRLLFVDASSAARCWAIILLDAAATSIGATGRSLCPIAVAHIHVSVVVFTLWPLKFIAI